MDARVHSFCHIRYILVGHAASTWKVTAVDLNRMFGLWMRLASLMSMHGLGNLRKAQPPSPTWNLHSVGSFPRGAIPKNPQS